LFNQRVRFDLKGDSSSAAQPASGIYTGLADDPGYTAVVPTLLWTAGSGVRYGWVGATAGGFSRSTPGVPLLHDGQYGSAAQTFRVSGLESGTYLVSVTLGDGTYGRDRMRVAANGTIVFDNVASTPGQFQEHAFVVATGGGLHDTIEP